jgi:hypothetical protein
MAAPRRHHDAYGRPLPTLVEREQRSGHRTRLNAQQQQLIAVLLQGEYDELLFPGTYAEVTLMFDVRNGTIVPDVYLTRRQQHRPEGEEK